MQATTEQQTKSPTRSDYLNGRCTHREYYAAICKDGGVSFFPGEPFIKNRVRPALEAGDEHLNTIPLHEWDRMAGGTKERPIPFTLAQAFRDRGDYATPAGLVCVYKEAARRAAEASHA
jgi:hypothetical protein